MNTRKGFYDNREQIEALILRGEYRQAGKLIQQTLRHRPARFEALLDYGYVLAQQDRHEEAQAILRRALMASTACAQPRLVSFLWYRLSLSLAEIKRWKEALDCIDQAEDLLSTYDSGPDEPEEYSRVREGILFGMLGG